MAAKKKPKRAKKKATRRSSKGKSVSPRGVDKDGLNPKQRLFVDEYIKTLNAKQSAIKAGYSAATAAAAASRLLTHVNVKAVVQKAFDERSKRNQMEADEVLREFARLARSDITNYLEVTEEGVIVKPSKDYGEDASRAICEVSETFSRTGKRQIKFKTHDKIRALEGLAKHLGLMIDKHEVKIDTDWADLFVQAK